MKTYPWTTWNSNWFATVRSLCHWNFHLLSFWLALPFLCDISYVTVNKKFSWLTSPLLSNVRQKAITPASPLLTMLVHISPSCWTIYRSFEIILEMVTVHWIGLHIQCSISGVGKFVKWQSFLQKTKNTSEPQNQFVVSIQVQFYRKCFT